MVAVRRCSASSSANANPSSTTDSETAPASPASDSNAARMASGIVCVSPGREPANSSVAPSSPSARAQHSTAPPASAGHTSGSVTLRNVRQRDSPSVYATPSRRGSTPAKPARAARTKNGAETKSCASTTAAVVNDSVSPTPSSASPR